MCGSHLIQLVLGAKCVESLASVKQAADGDGSSAEHRTAVTQHAREDHVGLMGTSVSSLNWENADVKPKRSVGEVHQKRDRK